MDGSIGPCQKQVEIAAEADDVGAAPAPDGTSAAAVATMSRSAANERVRRFANVWIDIKSPSGCARQALKPGRVTWDTMSDVVSQLKRGLDSSVMAASKTRRKSKAHERRGVNEQRILEAFEKVLAERPFRDLTVEEVMVNAGMSRTAFYRFFPDLEAILLRAVTNIADELFAGASKWLDAPVEEASEGALDEAGADLVATYQKHGPMLRAFADAAPTAPHIESAWRAAVESFVEPVARRIPDLNRVGSASVRHPEETARALVWMTDRYLLETYRPGPDTVPTKTAVETLVAIWRRTIFAPEHED